MKRTPTPAQTAGPFFHLGMDWYSGPPLDPQTDAVRIEGRVLDANGPVSDALLELWHAAPNGSYDHVLDDQNKPSGAQYFHRVATGTDGGYVLRTARPGAVQSARFGSTTPHIHVHVFARGLLSHLTTRIYFPEDAHDEDPVLGCVPVERRSTLIAGRLDDGVYGFDIVLQGPRETAFLAV